ncbi:MAG TPA: M20 family metallo-hydrolase [Candidatus Wallbacteria bacterium]|nr:MAG: Succinyl-diaminopimelate desuccinylase [bacterium ADurb.Bin243]HPG57053.1 M20 family metallo-hydrolase [Candidatus Wallbacteria bacterium]
MLEKILKRIDGYQEDMIKLQTEITAIPALSPENGGDGEHDKAEYLKKVLADFGFCDIKTFHAPDDRCKTKARPSVIAKVRGKSSAKTFWVMSHTDIVPPGELSMWNSDPYKVVVKDGKLFGRGVEDNQQGLVSSVFTFKAFIDEKITPEYDLGLLLVADEETGSKYGLGYLIKQHPELFGKNDIICVPDGGNPDGTMIEIAEKSIAWMKIRTTGKQCHGSRPECGINAHRANAHLIVKFDALYKDFPARDELFEPPISTFEPTKKDANVPNINTIPGDDVFYMDCRVLPRYDLKNEVLPRMRAYADEVEKQFGVKIEFSYPQIEQAAPATSGDSEVVKLLSAAVRDIYKKEPKLEGIGGGTVAAFFRRAGIPCVVWSRLDESCHQPNEYCIISNMIGDSKVFAHMIMNMK